MRVSVKKNESGAALLEVLVAIAVFAVAGAIVIRLFGFNARVLGKAEREREILDLAGFYMERAKGSLVEDDRECFSCGDYEIVVEQKWADSREVPQFEALPDPETGSTEETGMEEEMGTLISYQEKSGLRYITVTVLENGESVYEISSSSRKGEKEYYE